MRKRSGLLVLGAAVLLNVLVWIRGGTSHPAHPEQRPGPAAPAAQARAPRPAAPAIIVRPPVRAAPPLASPSEEELAKRKRVREVAASIAQLLRDHLYESDAGRAYRACVPVSSARCRELLSSALYAALAHYVEPELSEGRLGLAEIDGLNTELVHREAGDVLESSDPIERVSMLTVLERSHLPAKPLPAEAYRELSQKPVVETQLLLTRSLGTGLPAEKIDEVAYLAGADASDERVQEAALAALAGRTATHDALNEAVRNLIASHPADWDGFSAYVAPALARCGGPCGEVTAELVARSTDSARLAITIMLSTMREQQTMLARLEPALSDQALADLRHELGI